MHLPRAHYYFHHRCCRSEGHQRHQYCSCSSSTASFPRGRGGARPLRPNPLLRGRQIRKRTRLRTALLGFPGILYFFLPLVSPLLHLLVLPSFSLLYLLPPFLALCFILFHSLRPSRFVSKATGVLFSSSDLEFQGVK